MSNPIKAVGKAFKSVVKVAKKVALPALAIGAVVLTGGAALGVLPSVGSLAGSLGLSSALTGILVGGAKAATFGAIGSLLTGGNPIKGATKGFLIGGALGGLGALANGSAAAANATTAANGVSTAGNSIEAASQAVQNAGTVAPAAASAAPAAAAGSGGLGTAISSAGASMTGAAPAIAAPVAQSLMAPVPNSGGVMGWLNRNPVVGGQLIQGLGQGLMASEQAKDARRAQERRAANYSDTSGLFFLDDAQGGYLPDAGQTFTQQMYGGRRVTYDPRRGRIVAEN